MRPDVGKLDGVGAELGLPMTLREYQWEGIAFLANRRAALLADEMGLGKTVQAIVAIMMLVRKEMCRNALVICPASLCHNWELEFLRWAPSIAVRKIRGNQEDRSLRIEFCTQRCFKSEQKARS